MRFLAFALALIIGCLLLLHFCAPTRAHDSWISKGGWKNPAGEWCCGAEDCGVVSYGGVKATTAGYEINGTIVYDPKSKLPPDQVHEVVPYSQALPSPDGAYWRCKRPDGSPRCFFAPPPGS